MLDCGPGLKPGLDAGHHPRVWGRRFVSFGLGEFEYSGTSASSFAVAAAAAAAASSGIFGGTCLLSNGLPILLGCVLASFDHGSGSADQHCAVQSVQEELGS